MWQNLNYTILKRGKGCRKSRGQKWWKRHEKFNFWGWKPLEERSIWLVVPMVPLFFIGFATFFKLSQGGTLLMKKNLGQKKYGFLFYSQILLHLGYFHMIIFTKGFFGLDILFLLIYCKSWDSGPIFMSAIGGKHIMVSAKFFPGPKPLCKLSRPKQSFLRSKLNLSFKLLFMALNHWKSSFCSSPKINSLCLLILCLNLSCRGVFQYPADNFTLQGSFHSAKILCKITWVFHLWCLLHSDLWC